MTFSTHPQVNEAVTRIMFAGGETPYGQSMPMTLAQIRAYIREQFGMAAARSLTLTVH